MNQNTFSVKDGKVYLNGEQVYCVTGFKYETDGQHFANVTLSFDVPIKGISQEMHLVTGEKFTIPVRIGDRQIRSVTIHHEK